MKFEGIYWYFNINSCRRRWKKSEFPALIRVSLVILGWTAKPSLS